MIELTPEQRAAIEAGRPVAIVDPVTHDDYVLIRAEEYERLAGDRTAMVHEPSPEIAPMVLRSMQAFWRDLPGLLQKRRNRKKWAAYHGDERVVIARSEVEAYQECFRRGLKRGEFYVGWLREEPDGIPPWGTIQGEWSFYEATDEPITDEA
jgi:PHD/YefM family antitoxin component YafN of YafNO toxin-antitoxin module